MIDLRIKDKKNCMGCYACSNVCPNNCVYMVSDNEGFWYPKVDYKECIKCGLCIKACPVINKAELQKNEIKSYACMNKDEDIRLKSSSGGLFTIFAELVIDKGGVVFGAGFNEDFTVSHSYIETKDKLEKFRGSKYVQSKIGDTYKQAKKFLDKGRVVLFTGTPCQIAGLKRYLDNDYENLLCQDIICHGVPSTRVWQKYLEFREKRAGSAIKSITFRSKVEGWKNFSLSIIHKNGFEYNDTIHKDAYLVGFNKNLFLRPSCYACNFKTKKRQSDITLGDFWGVDKLIPDMDDDSGNSLLIIHTSKGNDFFNEIKHKLLVRETQFEEAIKYNPAMLNSMEIHPKREQLFDNLSNIDFDILIKMYCTDKLSLRIKRKIKVKIKNLLINLNLFDLFIKVRHKK